MGCTSIQIVVFPFGDADDKIKKKNGRIAVRPCKGAVVMTDLIVREITPEETAAAAALISAAFAPVAVRYEFPQDQDLKRLTERLEEEREREVRQFGAWRGEKLAGYFSLEAKDEEVFEISRFCVRPECQRQGLGEQLLRRAVAEIRRSGGVAAVCAVVGEDRSILHWLERNRFFEEVSGQVPGIPCPVYILQKDLPPEGGCAPEQCAGCAGGCG